MVRRSFFVPFPILAVLCTAATAVAQEPAAPGYEAGAPAHVSFVEGSVSLEREGRIDEAPGNMPLLSGDRLRTRNGRVEILFADGSTLHLDQDTTLDLQSDELVRLIAGRVRLSIPGPSRDMAYRIDSATGWAQIADAGEYRASFLQNELEVAVLRGRAELINEDGRTPLRAGERAFARANAAPSYAYVFNSAAWDSFDRWSEARRSERLGLSTQYLPEEVRPYAASFDRHGSWRYESSYGYVWYPRVDVGWRPYYRGRWVTLRPYGATWVSVDPWGWPTHHYGRWGFNAGVWFWIPGRTWGPAWVSWAYAPGYVSWCPLGWNNRPVVQIVNVNIYRGYDPWRAWTVVRHRDFGGGFVHRTVVAGHRIDDRTRGSFVHRDRAPDVPGYAVPRGSVAPIRVAGTRASRESASPLLTNRGGSVTQPNRAASSPDRSFGRSATERRDGGSVSRGTDGASASSERATPSRPMVRSERGTQAEGRSQDAVPPETGNRAIARPGDRPAYQPTERNAAPSRPTYDPPARRAVPSATPGTAAGTNRRADAPTYRREDAYRARPDTYTPGERRAVPRGEAVRPPAASTPRSGGEPNRPAVSEPRAGSRGESRGGRPSYGPPPSSGPPPSAQRPSGGNRSGPTASQPSAPSGPNRGADRPAAGSRPSGGAQGRGGTARPRGGG